MTTPLLLLAGDNNCGTTTLFGHGLYDGLCSGGQVNITGVADISRLIANVVLILVSAAGALAIIFIIVGGIFYVTAAGDPARLKRAKEIIMQSVVGLLVISLAYAVVTFIAGQFK
jgi:hypothetical protein